MVVTSVEEGSSVLLLGVVVIPSVVVVSVSDGVVSASVVVVDRPRTRRNVN